MTASPEQAGTIYDIGYRRYDGPRLGRRGAIGAIVAAGLRASFGLGRSGRSKIIPWGAVILGLLPAGVAVAIRVLVGDIVDLYSYENYVWGIGGLLPIFMAAQAPELVVNDLRHRVLPLYFSRPIGRFDYVAAKLVALSLALLSLTLVPVLVLFLGRVLAAEDLIAAFGDELGALPAIVGSGIIHAVVLASLGLAICSLAARRAYAAGAVLAVFLIGGVISGTLQEVGGGLEVVRTLHQSPLDPRRHAGVAVRRRRGGVARHRCRSAARGLRAGIGAAAGGISGDARHPLPPSHDMSLLTLAGVSRWYGNVVAVNDVSFEVGPGITGLLGPERGGEDDAAPPDVGIPGALCRNGGPRRNGHLAPPGDLRARRLRPGARGVLPVPDCPAVRQRIGAALARR